MISAKDTKNLDKLFKLQESSEVARLEAVLGMKPATRKRKPPFHLPGEDGKVFPNYFTNVVVEENDQRLIKPMRYRVRPYGSREEVPTKFNVYNARIDSLETAKTWQPLFMRQHGVVPFVKFYEWVPGPDGKAKLITFFPEGREIMWAACLWDEWVSKDGQVHFHSFAIVTDDPPEEISLMGHDRCPIFLKDDYIDEWLNPQKSNKFEIYEMLKVKEPVKYNYEWAQ